MKEVIESMKAGKATGPDSIPNEALKHIWEGSKNEWLSLIRQCWETGTFPVAWKRTKVVWVPKKAGAFRPICLITAMGRVMDKITNNRVKYWAAQKGLLSEEQYGFRKGRSTIEACKSLVKAIREARAGKLHAAVVALDINQCF